jgi:glycosyltransferase involved in cell wall biosynthesis
VNEIRATLICTLKNEKISLKEFIDSLLCQSKIPDEIVIVDGGSTDGTIELINSYIKKGEPIKLIIKDGSNIAQGRNIAIKNATNDIIVSTDAGCKLDKDWFKNITKPFQEDQQIDVVAGWYEPDARSKLESCIADIYYPKLEIVQKNIDSFLPSSRSVAFKKCCWEKVSGYPEWLYTAEDTLFDLKLKKSDCNFYFAKDAVVYWRVRDSFKAFLKQKFLYAKGNGEARIFPPKLLLLEFFLSGVFLALSFYDYRYIIMLLLLWCLNIIITLKRTSIRKFKNLYIYVPLIIGSNFMTIYGYIKGRYF